MPEEESLWCMCYKTSEDIKKQYEARGHRP